MCSQQLSLLLWIRSSLHIKNLLSGMSFFFLNYLLAKVIYLLIRCYKTRFILRNKSNTDRNGVNKQNTHTTHTHTHTPSTPRKITLERVSIKIVITRLLSKQLWYFLVAVMVLHEKEKCKISKLKVHVNLAPLGGGGGGFSALCFVFALLVDLFPASF